ENQAAHLEDAMLRRLSKRRQTRLEADIRLLDKRLAEMVWRPVSYGISTRAMLILELRRPHVVRLGPLYPSKRACAGLPQDARSAPGRNPSPGRQNAGSRTSCSCSLPVSDKL